MAPAGRPGAKKGILERLDGGEVVVGDGSFLITLEKRGYVKAGLWTPEAVVEHPAAVRQLHMEFLRAGSNVMQTFTFSASEDNMESKWEDVNAVACDLAREVASKGDALVAGGICQTSVYKYHKDEARIKKLFRQQLEVFTRKNVDFLIAEYFEHVEEAVWAVEVLKESGKPVAATMCIGPAGDMHEVAPGECAERLVKAGAAIVGVNCRFGPGTSLKTVGLMKEGLGAAGLKAHLMDWSPELPPDGTYKSMPERPTTWGSGTLAGAVDLSPTTSGQSQRSWPQKGDFCLWLLKNMAAGEVASICTPNPGFEQGLEGSIGKICCQLQADLSVLHSQSQTSKGTVKENTEIIDQKEVVLKPHLASLLTFLLSLLCCLPLLRPQLDGCLHAEFLL
ncbi:S-methylmethionine--homocysteine S-methyltransferase BHMT2 isoform X1 [Nycticebus coucang]|uniref:S-methylmethionine--homocysteine S-methyltransferase BHMT2 isoform X1 n=1 Tax=Nycticebus coucang TaxID=9470 RepID=UPI00234CF921|nr:S-methylmethionine--homocysteine S-methyltransferase BHMT2 isoform X1 [Nycticebus coucang]